MFDQLSAYLAKVAPQFNTGGGGGSGDMSGLLGGLGGDIGSLGGNIATLLGAGGGGGMGSYEDALNVLRALQIPDYDMSQITPAQLRSVAEYFPEEYSAIIEQRPELVQDSPAMRTEQLRSLAGLREVADTGLGLADKVARDKALTAIANQQGGFLQAGLEDLASRGRLGGGAETAMRLGAGQQAMTSANAIGSDLVRNAQLQRLSALSQSGELAGQVRGQDIDVSQRSADIMNNFNEWVSRLKTMVGGQNAQSRQTARNLNASERQRIADYNAMNRQETATSNLERKNRILGEQFSNDLSRRSAIARYYAQLGAAKDAETAANNINIRNIGSGAGKILGSAIGGLL